MEAVNKSPSANSPQVLPVFLLLLVLFQALLLFSSLFFGFYVVEMAGGDAASIEMHGFLFVHTYTTRQHHTGSTFCLEPCETWYIP